MRLSKREMEILELLSCGYEDKEMAVILKISPRTVQTYVSRIVIKMQARNRVSAVANYMRNFCIKYA